MTAETTQTSVEQSAVTFILAYHALFPPLDAMVRVQMDWRPALVLARGYDPWFPALGRGSLDVVLHVMWEQKKVIERKMDE